MSATPAGNPVPRVREAWVPPQQPSAGQRVGGFFARYRPDHDGLVDLAFAAVVTGIALLGFRTGFIGWPWVLAAVSGGLLGLLVAHVVTSHRWPAVASLVGIALVYLVLGGPLAVRADLIGGVLPSGRTVADLVRVPVHGWKQWLTMLPPVDAYGPLVALPFLFGLVAAALILTIARTRRGPWLLGPAVLAVLGVSIVLGTLSPAARWVQGLVLALVLLAWLVARDRRSRPPLQNGAGHRARLVTAVALGALAALAAAVLGPVLPGRASGEPRTVARSYLEPPFDVAEYPSPLAGFRQYTEPNLAKLWDKPLLQVRGLEAGQPLRIATLDRYDGSVWGAANRAEEGSGDPGTAFQQVGSRIAADGPGEEREVTVTVPQDGWSDVWLPTAGTLRGVEFSGPRARELREQTWLNVDTDTAIVPARLTPGDSYTMRTLVDAPPTAELPKDLEVDDGTLTEGYDSGYLDPKVDEWSRDAGGGWSQLRAIAGYMSAEGAYTDGGTKNSYEKVYLAGHNTGRLARFAGSTQLAGDDEQFAATLALVGNKLGIPTRVVMGALTPGDGVIRGKDVHAWVEVSSGGSWVPLLPQTFVPDRNKKPKQQEIKTEERRVGAQVPPPSGVNPPSVLQGPEQAQNDTDLRKKKTRSPLDPSTWPWWLRVVVFFVLLPALVLAIAYGAVVGLKARRRRRHATTGPTPGRAALIWEDLLTEARSLGVAVPRGATRLEQAAALPVPTSALAGRGNALVFGPGDPPEQATDAYFEEAGQARTALRGEVPTWRRVLADADPRPLLRRSPGASRAPRTGDGSGGRLPRWPARPRGERARPAES